MQWCNASLPAAMLPAGQKATAGRGHDTRQAVEFTDKSAVTCKLLVHHRSDINVHFINGGLLNCGLQDQAAIV